MFNDLRLKALHKCDQTSEKGGITLNLRYVSSKFNSHHVNFDRIRYF